MATATKKIPPETQAPSGREETWESETLADRIAWGVDAIYRFLASLKLAVVSIGTLAATLAYATFFESWYGGGRGQEWIYRSPGFAILLAFLGMNILCAALIRYPWKKRQTGFVVTHAGLLTLLAGSLLQRANGRRGAGRHARGRRQGRAGPDRLSRDPGLGGRSPHPRAHAANSICRFAPARFEWGPGEAAGRRSGPTRGARRWSSFGLLGSLGFAPRTC